MRNTVLWRLRAKECAWIDCDTKYEWISDMKLWNTIKDWLKSPATPVEVEEVQEVPQVSCGDLFVEVCSEYGIGKTLLQKLGAIQKFEEWYDGDCDKESVRAAISQFKETDISIKAKITSYSKGKL